MSEPDYTTNDFGEATKTFSAAYTLWAHVVWKSSDRKEESQENVQGTDVVFYIRNIGVTINTNYKIYYNLEFYTIHGIKEIDGRDKFLEIETKIKDNN